MNKPIRLYLLGPFSVQTSADKPNLSRKTATLLAYLATTEAVHSRDALAALFCQEANDPAGTLRWHLSRIRRYLLPEILADEDGAVRFNTKIGWVDVLQFEHWIDTGERLAESVDLYRGEFLEGMDLKGAPEFELWLLGERTRLRRLYERALEQLVEQSIQQAAYASAIERACQLLQSDPLLENVHARLIWLYAVTGRRKDALRQYDLCQDLLQRELAVDPAPELVDLRARVLAGEVGPIQPARAIRLSGISAATSVDAPVLVGREPELDRLTHAWQQPGRVVLVAAEAGGGKTSLVQAFGQSLPDVQFLTGHCYESTRSLPYRPWIDLLQARLDQLGESALAALPVSWIEPLARLLPVLAVRRGITPPTDQGHQAQLFTAIAEVLLSSDQELLLFLDDLQWADEVSLQLFHFIAQQLVGRNKQALLVGAYRAEEREDNPALLTLLHDLQRTGALLSLTLSPLTAVSVETLVAQLWPTLPPGYRIPHIRDTLLAETGGNPLFLTELLQELATAERLPATMPIPPSLQVLIKRRLRQLPESGRQVIEALAVLDVPATFEQVRDTSGRSSEEGEMALDLGLRWRLLQTQATDQPFRIDFSHDLMRDAVLAEVSAIRRQRLHGRAAQVLSQGAVPAATLAYHWRMAGDRTQEGHAAYQAGKEAAALGAHHEAIRYLRRAAECLTGNDQFEPRLEWIRLLEVISQWQEAETVAQDTLVRAEAAGNRRVQGRCQIELARIARMQGENEKALTFNTQALEHLQAVDDSRGLSRAYSGMGAITWAMGDYARALEFFRRQLQIDERIQDQAGISAALGALGVIYADFGDYVQAHAHYLRQLDLCRRHNFILDTIQAVANLANLYASQGHFAAALQGYRVQLRRALDVGSHWIVGVGLQRMAQVYLWQRDYGRMERVSQQAVDLLRKLNVRYYLCEALYQHTALRLAQHHTTEAERLVQEAQDMAQDVHRSDIVFDTRLLGIQLQVGSGQMGLSAAVTQLESMLSTYVEPDQQAAIHYTVWTLDSSQSEHRQRASDGYVALYKKTPDFIYHRRLQEMTGKAPAVPQLPPLPGLIATSTLELEPLLGEVDRLLHELAA